MPMEPVVIAKTLVEALRPLRFKAPVTHVYNPLEYAFATHRQYLERYGRGTREVVFLGMNPGPWGMAQTGVPFGQVDIVRHWLGIEGPVGKPANEHPKRHVLGFACRRSEISGTRLWGWAEERFKTPDHFFARFFVANYCPLTFVEKSGKNRTPDKLPANERAPLYELCDGALRRIIEYFQPQWVIGVGNFAEARAREALAGMQVQVGRVLHPSPASPGANRGWAEQAEQQLAGYGIEITT